MSQSGRDKKKLSQLEVSVKTLREVDDYLHPDIPRFHGSLHQDILGKVSTLCSTARKVDHNLTLHSGSLGMNENERPWRLDGGGEQRGSSLELWVHHTPTGVSSY